MTPIADSTPLLILYSALLVLAGFQDFRSLRISNTLSVSVLVVALAGVGLHAPFWQWWQYGASFAFILAIGLVLFRQGWLGGGDVKLFAASATAFPISNLLWLVSAVTIIGGLVAFALMVLRARVPQPFLDTLGFKGLEAGKLVPYGIAIAAGSVAATMIEVGGAEPQPISVTDEEFYSSGLPERP